LARAFDVAGALGEVVCRGTELVLPNGVCHARECALIGGAIDYLPSLLSRAPQETC
jgi:hypothetical protein